MNIIQEPLYRMLATDEEIIFAVQDIAIAASKIRVKYIAEVYVSGYSTQLFFSGNKIATLKVIPNDAGTGIFDFSRALEAYVSPDYLGGKTVIASTTQYYTKANGIDFSETQPHSIHEIDKHSLNRNACKIFGIKFYLEYADGVGEPLQNTSGSELLTKNFYIHNAVRQEDDVLAIDANKGNFGYNYAFNEYVLNRYVGTAGERGKFLTNAPHSKTTGQ